MKSALDSLISLPGVTVEGRSQVEGFICFHLRILAKEIDCVHCGENTQELHQIRPILVRDLPAFGQPVYLRVPRRQFYCRSCQKYVTERVDFLNWRHQYTKRYEENIYQRVLHSSDKVQLEQILSQSACLRFAYEMKEEFREIYQTSKSVQSGIKRMQAWLVHAQVLYGKTAQTIREHLSGK
jgi:transposase